MIQLDLFEKDDVVLLLEEVKKIRESSDKVRKGVFAEVGEVKQEVNLLKEILERFLAKQKVNE